MHDQDRDIATLLDDVKTIKAILQNEDAPLPRVWIIAWVVAPVVAVLGLVQYVVPFYRTGGFDTAFLWLWLPMFCVGLPLVLGFLAHEVAHRGRRFLGQSRVRHLLFARFLIPPAAVALIWLLARHPSFSLEGSVLLVVSIWLTAVEQVFPWPFRFAPVGFLVLGLVELVFQLTGPEVTLVDTWLFAANVGVVGLMFRHRQVGSP